MFYKNTSYSNKTFYGVTFKPGETKEVDGYINTKCMIPAEGPANKKDNVQQKPSPEQPKKEAPNKVVEGKKSDEVKSDDKKSEQSDSKPDKELKS